MKYIHVGKSLVSKIAIKSPIESELYRDIIDALLRGKVWTYLMPFKYIVTEKDL